MKQKIKEAVKDIASISGIPTKLIYAAFSAAVFTITAGIGTLILLTVISIGSTIGFIELKHANATQPKTDPCRALHEEAIKSLNTEDIDRYAPFLQAHSLQSIAYSFAYQNCGDLERQR